MAVEPTPGLVIRYDFLWKDNYDAGLVHGLKDRPCAIILVSESHDDGTKEIIVCAISHTPPTADTAAVEIRYKVTQHLGLDYERMWIKTDQVNVFQWEKGRLPFGVMPARNGEWAFGVLPSQLTSAALDQVRERSRERAIAIVARDC